MTVSLFATAGVYYFGFVLKAKPEFTNARGDYREVSFQSSPKSSAGCGVRMVPLPQRRSLAGQYLSHPQQMRSGFLGRSGSLDTADRTWEEAPGARFTATDADCSSCSRTTSIKSLSRAVRTMSVTCVTDLVECYQRNADRAPILAKRDRWREKEWRRVKACGRRAAQSTCEFRAGRRELRTRRS